MLMSMSETKNANLEKQILFKRTIKVEWLGQTLASIFWIVSVFSYGLNSTGDWLQLLAASAWLIANIASLVSDVSS